MKPDFIGIGAQKAGTTWIHTNLINHPSIWMPPIKEIHYFNEVFLDNHSKWIIPFRQSQIDRARGQANSNKELLDHLSEIHEDIGWYKKIWEYADESSISGEITPEYALLPKKAIEEIQHLNPDIKILFILRDPIERAWSHIRKIIKDQGLAKSEALRLASNDSVLDRSKYSVIIKRWQHECNMKNMLILDYKELVSNPLVLLNKICSFLGVDFKQHYFPDIDRIIYQGEGYHMPENVEMRLKKHLCYEYQYYNELKYADI